MEANALTADDLLLLCDLFYLPFEHGSRGLRLLHDYNWLVQHAATVLPKQNKPEVILFTTKLDQRRMTNPNPHATYITCKLRLGFYD